MILFRFINNYLLELLPSLIEMNYLFFNSDLVTIMIPKIGNNDIKR